MTGVVVWLLLAIFSCAGNSAYVQKKQATKIYDDHIVVSLSSSLTAIVLCPSGVTSATSGCTETQVTLRAASTNPKHEALTIEWVVNAGRLSGEGLSVKWDLGGVAPGQYTATAFFKGKRSSGNGEITITIADCTACDAPPPPCPRLSILCRETADDGSKLACSVHVDLLKAEPYKTPTFKWTVTKGRILSGQTAKDVEMDLKGFEKETVTATVEVDGFDPACMTTVSYTSNIHR